MLGLESRKLVDADVCSARIRTPYADHDWITGNISMLVHDEAIGGFPVTVGDGCGGPRHG